MNFDAKDIPGYESLYSITNDGRVWRKIGKNCKNGRWLKPCSMTTGYHCVVLSKDGLVKNHRIHRLVAGMFISNPEEKPCVNHKNGIKTDNRVENLEWCTYSENTRHALKTKLYSVRKGIRVKQAKLSELDVRTIRKRWDKGDVTFVKLGKEYNVHPTSIRDLVLGKTWRHIS